MKKLILAGGTGFLGQALIAHFKNEFDSIVILSRAKGKTLEKVRYLQWDAKTFGDWCNELEGAHTILNLCGKSVDCRYTTKNMAEIFASRLDSTKIIGAAILKCKQAPALWINGTSATIYRHSEDTAMTESKGEIGEGFSVEVCKAWEKVFDGFELPATRKVNMRISMVFGKTAGVYPVLMSVVKKGLGGTMGNGRQQVSWIHVEDFCKIVDWMMRHEKAKGVYNVVSKKPVRNKKLMQMLRKKAGIFIGLPAAAWMLKIGAFIIGTETELILKSRYIIPEKLVSEGFKFKYRTMEECLADL